MFTCYTIDVFYDVCILMLVHFCCLSWPCVVYILWNIFLSDKDYIFCWMLSMNGLLQQSSIWHCREPFGLLYIYIYTKIQNIYTKIQNIYTKIQNFGLLYIYIYIYIYKIIRLSKWYEVVSLPGKCLKSNGIFWICVKHFMAYYKTQTVYSY